MQKKFNLILRLALFLTLLLAVALRLYRLDVQSFWNDEGNTARLVERPVTLIIEGAAGDIHPPGYYLLLHAWRAVAGESEFALRAYSVLCGVLMVAVTAAVGKRVGGWTTAVGSAFFTALHPLAVYYSQEARMYAQLGLVSVLTLWAAGRITNYELRIANYADKVGAESRFTFHVLRFVFPLSFIIALGLYTQYAYIFALFGLNVAFGLWWLVARRGDWRLIGYWFVAHALGGALFLPWAPIAMGASGWRPPDLDAAQAFQALSRALLAGITLPDTTGNYIIALAAIIVIVALLTRVKRPFIKWAAFGMALMPAALILALGIYRPAYLKFLMASVAPISIVLTIPLAAHPQRGALVRRWSVVALLLVVMPVCGIALNHLYFDPTYARDNYRAIAEHIAAEGQTGDAVILSAPNQWEVFTYYYRGPLPVYPAPYRPTAAAADVWLDEILAQHKRVFVLFWGDTESDPERLIEPRLAQRAYKAGDTWMSSIRVAVYGIAATVMDIVPVDYALGDGITLAGYSTPPRVFHSGEIVPVALFWQTKSVPDQRYKVFVHLVDADGALRAQVDAEPGGGFNLTSQWPTRQLIVDRYGVVLPADLAPGQYTLLVGMYGFDGVRLDVTQGDRLIGDAIALAEVQVANSE